MKDGSPRILVIRLSAIGDCLHAVPSLVALRHQFSNAWIGWAIESAPYELLRGHPLVDQFHIFPRDSFRRKEGTFWNRVNNLRAFRKEIREINYEVGVDFQGLTKSGLVAWWSGAPTRIGFRGLESREFNGVFTNRRITTPGHAVHVVEKNLSLLKPLGIEIPRKPVWVMPEFAEEKAAMDRFLEERGLKVQGQILPFVVVNPGATWHTKRWAPERFGQVTRGIVNELNHPVVVTWGSEEELKSARVILEVAGDEQRVHLAPPTNLRELAALFSRCILFVGNDTGPLHLAVALGKKSVAVFGATDPLRNGPYGREHRIQAQGPECQPCWETTCRRGDLACLNLVQPEAVLASCRELIVE